LKSADSNRRTRVPVWFHLKDKSPFGLAGIWDVWRGPDGKVFTVAILTTTPNDLTRTVHDRMPVILTPEAEAVWLDPTIDDSAKVMSVVGPYPAGLMEATDVNPALNRPSFEDPDCRVSPTAA
jgi:putative SOS response-associated peptidase YedK